MQTDELETQLTPDDLARFRDLALANARALGISDAEWERRRRAEGGAIADILMALDPQQAPVAPDDGLKASSRRFGRLRIDDFVLELRDARRVRDVGRLKQLLDELARRRSRHAVRLAASVQLSLLAIERPEMLSFRAE